MALWGNYSLLPQRYGLNEKRIVLIGYVHFDMLTSIQVECAKLSKVYASTDSPINITNGYWAVLVIAIPYLTADRSQQKISYREMRARTN